MKKTNETDSLNELIILQEQQYHTDLRLLKEQLHIAYESVRPLNLIKTVVHEVSTSPEIKNDMLDNVIGITTGYLSKKLLIDTTDSPIKKGLGFILQFAVGNVVAKHADTIKVVGANLLHLLTNKNKD